MSEYTPTTKWNNKNDMSSSLFLRKIDPRDPTSRLYFCNLSDFYPKFL